MKEVFTINQSSIFTPKQPFFVIGASQYYKYNFNQWGIVHFYCFKTGNENFGGVLAIPDGCVDILFCCTDQPSAFICGTVLEPTLTLQEKNAHYFGVRFKPGYNPILDQQNIMPQLIRHMVPFDQLINDQAMFERITTSRIFPEQIRLFLDSYLKIYQRMNIKMEQNLLFDYITGEIIRLGGELSLDDIAASSGYSPRYIHKVFTTQMGLSPKLFSRIIRFQQLISRLNQKGNVKLTDVAADLGFFDQSHMLKDFKSFTGITPKKYLHSINETAYNQKLIILE
jgi:AraC-like DNA-binding protein